jgi:hypothetical protein
MKAPDHTWNKCVGLFTDAAAAITGKHSSIVKRNKDIALNIKWIHCFIHREEKTQPELHDVLNLAVKMVNSIESSALNTRCCAILCDQMGSEHRHLLFHTEVSKMAFTKEDVTATLPTLRRSESIFAE